MDIDPEREAIVTIGSKEGLAHLMLATLDHCDTMLVPNQSYPIHIYAVVIAGAQVRPVPMVTGVDFFAELERAILEGIPKPKMVILGFPSNPTAQCVELDFFERVVALDFTNQTFHSEYKCRFDVSLRALYKLQLKRRVPIHSDSIALRLAFPANQTRTGTCHSYWCGRNTRETATTKVLPGCG